MENFYFVMPAYNEELNIESVVKNWYPIITKIVEDGNNAKLVIANDGSKDNTYSALVKLANEYPLLEVLDKPNSGHGATLIYLYNYALANNADYIFQTDSDGQTNPSEFWDLYNQRYNYNFQIGLRHSRKDGFSRKFVTKTLQFILWCFFGVWVPDANTPFRLMNATRLSQILKVIPSDYFLSNVAISVIAIKWNETRRWHPISFEARSAGVNSINFKRIFKIGIKALGDFKLLKNNIKQCK